MTSGGNCKIKGVSLGELIVDSLTEHTIINATFVLLREDQSRVGRVTKKIFSEKTMEAFAEFRKLVEADMAAELFEMPEVKFEEPRQA